MKNLYFLIFILVAVSCKENKGLKTKGTNKNIELVRQYFLHFNSHNWEEIAGMYVENAEFRDPSLGQGVVKQSRKQIIKKYDELNQVFPDIHDRIIKIYPSGNEHMIIEFVSTGTAPDGSKFELPICTVFTIKNGKITKDFTYYDNF
ncbi:nuclear transport factor 2 family protein [Aquimarina sediminis]|uniref:nuclear transport factor 2 family protein n=1 Tax=Aquimarina sediminis TaxID=2070536 RepID=UPI000CA05C31|nr:nuclear transport factor 2 family protein [Aquimarina sediminis]